MPILNRSFLATRQVSPAALQPRKHAELPPVGVMQIGDGNFLRGFADWMIEIANDAGVFNGQVSIVAARGPGAIPRLRAQDGLFTGPDARCAEWRTRR